MGNRPAVQTEDVATPADPRGDLIPCPYCGASDHSPWDQELGFSAVRCDACGLIYVNPRPSLASIDVAVRSGVHGATANHLNVVVRRLPTRVSRYRAIFARLFDDVWRRG